MRRPQEGSLAIGLAVSEPLLVVHCTRFVRDAYREGINVRIFGESKLSLSRTPRAILTPALVAAPPPAQAQAPAPALALVLAPTSA